MTPPPTYRQARPEPDPEIACPGDDPTCDPGHLYRVINAHEARLDVMVEHHRTVAAQIGELTVSMDQLRREIPALMAAGIMQAVSNPELWRAAGEAMGKQASGIAGGWLFGGLRAVLNRAAWVAVIALGLYAVGGPGALVAYFKATHP